MRTAALQVKATRRTHQMQVISFAPNGSNSAPVKFVIKHPVAYGKKIAVTGAHPALGVWQPKEALEATWGEGHKWTVETALPAGPLEVKLLIVDDTSVAWQPGPNIALTVPEDGNALEVVVAGWDAAQFETFILAKPTKEEAGVSGPAVPAPPAVPVEAAAAPAVGPAAAVKAAAAMPLPAVAAAAAAQVPAPKPAVAATAAGVTLDGCTLEKLTVGKLKAACKQRGLPVGGKKKDLVDRLTQVLSADS